MNKYIYAGLLVLALILTSTHSFAKLTITPSVNVRGEYNDNIFLADTNKEDDFITTLTPGIMLEYSPNRSLNLSLDYGLNFKHYSEDSSRSDETHSVQMKASAKPFKRITIDLTDTYTRVPIDIRDQYTADNTLTNMTDSNSFLVSTRVVLPVTSAISTSAGYSYRDLWYEDEGSTDSETHSAFFMLTDKISSKIIGALKYSYTAYRPDLTGQQSSVVAYDKQDGLVVVEYRMASNFIVDAEIGTSWVDYDTGGDSQMAIWNIGADYTVKFMPDTSIEINYSSALSDSTNSGAARRRMVDLAFKTGKTLKLTLNPYYSVDTFSNTDRKDKVEGVNVDLSRPLGSKITLSVNGLLERQDFTPGTEKVGRYGLGCSFDYKLSSKITAGIGYRHNGRDSNIAGEDFANNIGWLQAKVSF